MSAPTKPPPEDELPAPDDEDAEPASISEQSEIGADVPMAPLIPEDAVGMFTPASIQRYQMRQGSALLARGDSGPAVLELQRELRALDLLPVGEDFYEEGVYGDQTAEAVRAFQEDHGIPPTGSCDVTTRHLIRAQANDV